jgi:coniferyl-aldehyde dehydrogenase
LSGSSKQFFFEKKNQKTFGHLASIGGTHVSELHAIKRLHTIIKRQREAHRKGPPASAAERRERLRIIIDMLMVNRMKIRDALTADHGVHPELMTDIIEVNGGIARARQALDQLDIWMAPQPRPLDAGFGNARAWMEHQAKGVIGNMVPWNFPFEIGLGPVAEMFGAGNRVVIKPSELMPASAELLRDMVAANFDEDVLTTVLGGPAVARAFAAAPWDHLLFTGSTQVGREVMRIAAENLTPLTLELGSKSPIIVTRTGLDARAVRSIIGLKLVKSGQVCVSADHVHVPRTHVAEFVERTTAYVRENTPKHSRSPDCTSIVNEQHFTRLQGLIADARAHGADIVIPEQNAAPDSKTRQMPLTLVLGVTEDMRVAREEIFGPVLPIFAYDRIEHVVDRLNRTDKPLTMSIFSQDQSEIDYLIASTTSGGVSVNGAALNTACINLGFGGVGASGMGRHHGIEGFHEFSNKRAMFVRGEEDHIEIIFPPYREAAQAAVAALFL